MKKKFSDLAEPVRANPERQSRVDAYREAIDIALQLAAVRRARGLTQEEVAERLHVSQSNVSQLERTQDPFLSTLRDYVAALGGRLEITAVFPDDRIVLVHAQVGSAAADPDAAPPAGTLSADRL